MNKSKAKGKGSWYYTWRSYCVLCGRETVFRERRWTKKPKNWADRNRYEEDACGDHFV